VAAYHSAVSDILEWKGVRIEGMPEMAPPKPEDRADLIRLALLPSEAGAP
jgi:hypothetical protein